jgi:hypothetical protein
MSNDKQKNKNNSRFSSKIKFLLIFISALILLWGIREYQTYITKKNNEKIISQIIDTVRCFGELNKKFSLIVDKVSDKISAKNTLSDLKKEGYTITPEGVKDYINDLTSKEFKSSDYQNLKFQCLNYSVSSNISKLKGWNKESSELVEEIKITFSKLMEKEREYLLHSEQTILQIPKNLESTEGRNLSVKNAQRISELGIKCFLYTSELLEKINKLKDLK